MLVLFRTSSSECVGEIQNVGIGGLKARVPKLHFADGDMVKIGPPDEEALEYEVCWLKPSGASFEVGFRYPHSVADFWRSWAADLLAGSRPTVGEVVERRRQVRLGCTLKGLLKVRRKQFPARVLDIGGGGALIESDEVLQEGTSVHLTVKNPVQVGHLPCGIVRSWPGSPSRYGLVFVNLRERHRLALVRLLDFLLRHPAER